LLLLDNRFLGALLRAFENRPGPISPVFKSDKYVDNFLFKSEQNSTGHFWKPVRANFVGFEKLLANSKAFHYITTRD
jgi:hypothetical protein